MQIAYHLGAHCTDEDRLVRCLLKNRGALAAEGIAVPSPTRYRRLLRDTAVQLKGQPASAETRAMVLEQILDDEEGSDNPSRMVLSWENFLAFPQWALRGRLYALAGERLRAFTRIFPGHGAEFHLAIRNPATFLPGLYEKQRGRSREEFLEGTDPLRLRWSDVVRQILACNPGVPLTVWCDEDTPLIWPEVLRAVAGHSAALTLSDTDELLAGLMDPEGMQRLSLYLAEHPPESPAQRQRIVAAFLDRHALAGQLEMQIDMPGWTGETLAALGEAYAADVADLRGIAGVRVIDA